MQFAEASTAREAYNASRAEVIKLSEDPKTREEALELYNTVTADLMEPYIAALQKLKTLQQDEFDKASDASAAAYHASRNIILTIIGSAVIFGIVLAILLARSIVRPLRNAVSVAESIKDGNLNNSIDTAGSDETASLLGSLDHMQTALRARDEKDADSRGQIAAIGRAQAVIEFDMNGTVRDVNDNFARVMGYNRADVIGKHHSMFVESSYAGSADYRAFWEKLNRGEPDINSYKRIAKGGREVWIQASYNPIPDA